MRSFYLVPTKLGKTHLFFKNFQFYNLPYKERVLELMWKIFHWPSVDKFLPNIDVLYVPGEQLVPSKKYKIFHTIHDIYHLKDSKWRLRIKLLKFSYRTYLPKVYKILTVSNYSKKIIEMFQGAKK